MKERPILFSGPMVRAILDGRKTQTRRVLKGSTEHKGPYNPAYIEAHKDHAGWAQICPYGQPGDRLWVRESFWGCDLPGYGDQPCVVYDDEWAGKEYRPVEARPWARKFGRIPSIHMPRDCSRITLEITGVRVERLQDISEEDARAEGIAPLPLQSSDDPSAWWQSGPGENQARTPIQSFALLWQSINGPDSWNENPWVWVIEFTRLEQQEAAA